MNKKEKSWHTHELVTLSSQIFMGHSLIPQIFYFFLHSVSRKSALLKIYIVNHYIGQFFKTGIFCSVNLQKKKKKKTLDRPKVGKNVVQSTGRRGIIYNLSHTLNIFTLIAG